MRILIDLPKKPLESLAEICERENISRSEAIRRAVFAYINEKIISLHDKDHAFGIWKSRNIDALDYEDEIRKDWERDI